MNFPGDDRRTQARFLACTAQAFAIFAASAFGSPLGAQTDYYNTDAGRPIRIEDAYSVERYAFEFQAAPLRLQRSDEGVYTWMVEPEIAYGVLPRTHLEIGFPLAVTDNPTGDQTAGLEGVDVSVLHNLNAETAGLPAFGVAADVLLPFGNFAPDRAYVSVKTIATRTFRFSRFHLNGQYTFGATPEMTEDVGELSRWMAGIAIDKTFPLQAALLTGDVYVEQPLHEHSDLRWTVEVGTRYQLNPFFALDAGIGRHLSGEDRGWFITLGAARAFGIRSLFPGPRM